MSDSGGSVGAGWLHAEGDPPGTQRYWDGTAWLGEPQPAPQAAPAPGGFTGFEEPKKKRSVLKWVLGVGLVLLLGIGGCSYALFRAVSGPIDAGNEFLAAVQTGDFDEAWALSDSSCFENGSPQQLAEIFAGETIAEYRLSSSNVNSNNGSSRGSTSGTVTFTGDDVRDIEIFANKRGDDWLICGFNIDAPGG